MKLDAFDYHLPPERIAARPAEPRESARLLVLPATGPFDHRHIADLPDLIAPGDLLILNDTRVIPARAFGRKASGGRVEFLLERLLDAERALCHLRSSRSPKIGAQLLMEGGATLEVVGRDGALFELRLVDSETPGGLLGWLEAHGHMPLPTYIERPDDDQDRHDYQTVFARRDGAVAAPTAGLHMTEALLEKLKAGGVETAFVTLHVGAGTFQPVRSETIEGHEMHREWTEVPEATVEAVAETRRRGGRVIAIGTTAVRAIETAARAHPERAARGEIGAFVGDTQLFLYPGVPLHVIDAMLTNFHLPRSTLLMLVSAFAGRERVLAAYHEAIARGYRFYSFGDAMFIEANSSGERKTDA
ncbi:MULTISPECIES: tRNA preQ1(34) S-adenosylmethionine ribosyltransferase-isomerase QueA [unclassified Guyparkeria]|uniref:tRNA preQ1(34) S-adenosylmethionine ribosyltransferase-isomerase QueA n=1 Tax=unclassified Guyparkeria TaxID=2626246 RepID=UPI0007337DF4|nr:MULTISPECIES: tRNA preQ1(34) S-adenosylmethionine ribosyltransferase-isomerase QueA [unclassified Guyparkeria]KTG16773.1 S-adenosylmethionine:tRNA ribosyltransferase-isomerase [Guyparkeria sp. XI15]OAE85807.1 S-adenosylmethionine:tRNA ribosyltransferase-isomerase [Guyparkeria sp. WRN-7]